MMYLVQILLFTFFITAAILSSPHFSLTTVRSRIFGPHSLSHTNRPLLVFTSPFPLISMYDPCYLLAHQRFLQYPLPSLSLLSSFSVFVLPPSSRFIGLLDKVIMYPWTTHIKLILSSQPFPISPLLWVWGLLPPQSCKKIIFIRYPYFELKNIRVMYLVNFIRKWGIKVNIHLISSHL